MIIGFLLGVIATASFTAALFFLRFWRETRDSLFLTFAIAFTIEGFNRIALLMLPRPNEGKPVIYFVRLIAFLTILIGIVRKNLAKAS